MRYIYIAILFAFSVQVGHAQQARGWSFELLAAYQPNYSSNSTKDVAVIGPSGFYELGARLSRKVYEKEQHSIHAGIGTSVRSLRGMADISYCPPRQLCLDIFIANKISTFQIQFPIRWDYDPTFSNRFGLSTALTPSFRIGQYGYYMVEPPNNFATESVELVPALTGDFGHVRLSLGVRAFNFRRVESAYRYKGTFLKDNPGYFDNTFEVDNPFKVFFQVGYLFGK